MSARSTTAQTNHRLRGGHFIAVETEKGTLFNLTVPVQGVDPERIEGARVRWGRDGKNQDSSPLRS